MQKNILALQFKADLESNTVNFAKVETLYKGGADVLFLPEVWCSGWFCEDFQKKAQDENGEIVSFLKDFAKKNNVNIVGGSYIRKTTDGLKNSTPVINKKGELLAHYDKNHLFTPDGEGCLESGEKLLCVELEGLKIGLSICYDIRFPELFRAFVKNGCAPQVMVNLSAWPKTRTHHYTTLCAARSIENQAYFLGLSQCGEIKNGVYNAGNSLLVNPFGEIVKQLDEKESYIFETIDTQAVAQIRENFPNLAAIRKGGYEVEYV